MELRCDTVCEEVGTISTVCNKVLWFLNFHHLKKNIRFKSPEFTLKNSTWQLRYCCFRTVLNSKEWLDIGVKLLSKTFSFEGQRVRFGITGNNLVISKTLESNNFLKYYSLTLPYEDEMYAWVPDGKLCLFFTIEDLEGNCVIDTIPKEKEETDNELMKESDRKIFIGASIQTEEEFDNELIKEADRNNYVDASIQTEEEIDNEDFAEVDQGYSVDSSDETNEETDNEDFTAVGRSCYVDSSVEINEETDNEDSTDFVDALNETDEEIDNEDLIDQNYFADTLNETDEEFDNEDFIETNRENFIDASIQTEEELGRLEQANEIHFVEVSSQTEEDTESWKLPEDFKEFLLQGNVCDIVLKVGEELYKSHRCILAARSPAFLDIVTQETKEKDIDVVVIPDIDPETFSVFHNYFYSGKVEHITSENAHNLYSVAHKYKVNELKKTCTDYMMKNIFSENFCDIFTLSLLHEENDLSEACWQFFMKNALKIITTSKWKTFLNEKPEEGNGLFVRLMQMNA